MGERGRVRDVESTEHSNPIFVLIRNNPTYYIMQSKAKTVEEYIAELPIGRQEAVSKLRKVILENLPEGFREEMSYGMIGYVVPHSIYPKGYHSTPKLPLPFINIASQKNYIAFYGMGVYADKKLLNWFTDNYAKHTSSKLDMGKGCIRFKKPDQIPFKLMGELASKVTVSEWIKLYEDTYVNKPKDKEKK
jgi:uncharacterized protein YdhG (YjbR/CyaY superfamily)